ncbi:MAG: hypothetical protein J6B23_01760 [Clostridia bacterium]|nr:hypothetical protein [Clostridia bacterium]
MKEEINLIKIFEIILKLWWVVLIFAIIGSLIAFSISTFLMTPMYTSAAKVYVSGSERVEGSGVSINDINVSQRLVSTYIEILCGNEFLTVVADDYNEKYKVEYNNLTAAEIKGNVMMDSANETEILKIEYQADSPKKAQRVLDVLLDNAQAEITRVMSGCKVSVVDSSTLPTTTSSPNIRQNTFIGLFLGIVLGVVVIFMRELFDTRIKDDEDLKSRYNIPVLGIIPNLDPN